MRGIPILSYAIYGTCTLSTNYRRVGERSPVAMYKPEVRAAEFGQEVATNLPSRSWLRRHFLHGYTPSKHRNDPPTDRVLRPSTQVLITTFTNPVTIFTAFQRFT